VTLSQTVCDSRQQKSSQLLSHTQYPISGTQKRLSAQQATQVQLTPS